MLHYCLPWLAAFCCAAVSGPAAGKESPEEPAVTVSLDGWRTNLQEAGPFSKASRSFSMDLKVRETSSSWKVAYGGESGSELALTDSEGSSPAKTNCHYSDSRSYQQSNIAGTIF